MLVAGLVFLFPRPYMRVCDFEYVGFFNADDAYMRLRRRDDTPFI